MIPCSLSLLDKCQIRAQLPQKMTKKAPYVEECADDDAHDVGNIDAKFTTQLARKSANFASNPLRTIHHTTSSNQTHHTKQPKISRNRHGSSSNGKVPVLVNIDIKGYKAGGERNGNRNGFQKTNKKTRNYKLEDDRKPKHHALTVEKPASEMKVPDTKTSHAKPKTLHVHQTSVHSEISSRGKYHEDKDYPTQFVQHSGNHSHIDSSPTQSQQPLFSPLAANGSCNYQSYPEIPPSNPSRGFALSAPNNVAIGDRNIESSSRNWVAADENPALLNFNHQLHGDSRSSYASHGWDYPDNRYYYERLNHPSSLEVSTTVGLPLYSTQHHAQYPNTPQIWPNYTYMQQTQYTNPVPHAVDESTLAPISHSVAHEYPIPPADNGYRNTWQQSYGLGRQLHPYYPGQNPYYMPSRITNFSRYFQAAEKHGEKHDEIGGRPQHPQHRRSQSNVSPISGKISSSKTARQVDSVRAGKSELKAKPHVLIKQGSPSFSRTDVHVPKRVVQEHKRRPEPAKIKPKDKDWYGNDDQGKVADTHNLDYNPQRDVIPRKPRHQYSGLDKIKGGKEEVLQSVSAKPQPLTVDALDELNRTHGDETDIKGQDVCRANSSLSDKLQAEKDTFDQRNDMAGKLSEGFYTASSQNSSSSIVNKSISAQTTETYQQIELSIKSASLIDSSDDSPCSTSDKAKDVPIGQWEDILLLTSESL
ncbi:hypothetical protein BGW36DRAFT_368238 [Talaromyces proteolyticus]|uniref:Uncharacterized protein n=1 Tax=Talaromyces proteolyticus TaxID=1131652 RepID=A0AAD4L657_9EURO|nr:uncharacterized protein BGW36DRAFT_368238 [Talaromyces proteolyticus]KAH8705826.1 hypothetical protein BGW36DRAFT_368238 [Talaromyces proteolyticus]